MIISPSYKREKGDKTQQRVCDLHFVHLGNISGKEYDRVPLLD